LIWWAADKIPLRGIVRTVLVVAVRRICRVQAVTAYFIVLQCLPSR